MVHREVLTLVEMCCGSDQYRRHRMLDDLKGPYADASNPQILDTNM